MKALERKSRPIFRLPPPPPILNVLLPFRFNLRCKFMVYFKVGILSFARCLYWLCLSEGVPVGLVRGIHDGQVPALSKDSSCRLCQMQDLNIRALRTLRSDSLST